MTIFISTMNILRPRNSVQTVGPSCEKLEQTVEGLKLGLAEHLTTPGAHATESATSHVATVRSAWSREYRNVTPYNGTRHECEGPREAGTNRGVGEKGTKSHRRVRKRITTTR
jgi:hypothetical protein